MKLPTFADFVKNPIAAIAFIALIAVGYLYVDTRNTHQAYLNACESREAEQNKEIKALREDLSNLQDKFIKLVEIQK